MDKLVVISFVGGQPSPIVNMLSLINDAHHVFVVSEESKKQMDDLLPMLREAKVQISDDYEVETVSSVKFNKIIKKFTDLKEKFAGRDLYINLTGGKKPWSLCAYQVFADDIRANLFYVDQDTNSIWNVKTGAHLPLTNNFCKEEPHAYTPFSDYSKEDDDVFLKIEKINKVNQFDFIEMTNDVRLSQVPPFNTKWSASTKKNSTIGWDTEAGSFVVHIEPLSKKANNAADFELKSPLAPNLIFNTAWYEYKIARLVSAWDEASGITLNNKWFAPGVRDKHDELVRNNAPLSQIEKCAVANEVDIKFSACGRLFFVEVKTNPYNSTDIDKFNSVVERVAGSAALKLFVVHKDIAKPDEKVAAVLDKCRKYGITVFSTYNKFNMKQLEEEFIALLQKISTMSNL